MKIIGWIFGSISTVGSVFTALKYLFVKTPEQKETEDLAKEKKHATELNEAFDKIAKSNDPVDLSRILNE